MKKSIVEPKYNKIKEYFKSGTYDKEKLNTMCMELIEDLADYTMKGLKEVEGIDLDTWKMRVWVLVEKAGCLPEFREPKEEADEEIEDTWYQYNEEEFEDLVG